MIQLEAIMFIIAIIFMMRINLILAVMILASCGQSSPMPAYAAQELPLYIYNIKTADSIDGDDAVAMAMWMRDRYLEATGFTVTYMYYEEVDAKTVFPYLDLHSSDYTRQNYRLNAFESWLASTKRWKKNALNYGVFPPMNCGGMKCFGGMARGGCMLVNGGISIGQAGKWSSHNPPRPRIPVGGGLVLAHECGHNMQMWHKSIEDGYPPNIMDQACGRFVDSHPTLPFIPESINQFNGCITTLKKQRLDRCKKKETRSKRRQCRKRATHWLALTDGQTDFFPAFE